MAFTLENVEKLKRFLFKLPSESEFNFTNDVRKEIRKAIFLAISQEGRYLNFLFSKVFLQEQNDICNEKFKEIMERDFKWRFVNYDSNNSRGNRFKQGKSAFHYKSPCASIFRKGEPIYRCLTCGFDDTCALCSNCYKPEFHEGHTINIQICQRDNGGVCDCGDPEAWVNEYTCPYASHKDDFRHEGDEIPKDLEESFSYTIEVLLDFVIDVMSFGDSHFEDPETSDISSIEIRSIRSSFDSEKYGYRNEKILDRNNDLYYLMVYNDQIRHYRDAVQRIHLASKKVLQFAMMITDKAQSYGKAKVISSRNLSLLKERQKILSATGIASCIRSYRDVFREEMCDEILIWINDLTESEIFRVHFEFKDLLCKAFCGRWNKGLIDGLTSEEDSLYCVGLLDGDLKIPKIPMLKNENKPPHHWYFKPTMWTLQDDLCFECNYNQNDNDYEPHSSHLGSRFQYFIYMDIRFWKSIRVILHDIYSTSLITNLNYKHIICSQYVDIYPAIADMFLTRDREPELSVMCTLSTQLFTCPSNSTSIIQHGDIARIFAAIYGFFTVEEIRAPECVDLSLEISMRSLKNRRWGQIFFDIGYILSRSSKAKVILTSNIVPMACDILALFQGKPVMKRESKNHIEFESPDYTAFFHAIQVIYQFGGSIANCIDNLEAKDIHEKKSVSLMAINYVIKFLLRLENNDYPGLVDDLVDINLSSDKLISKEFIGGNIIQYFRIDQEKVSFLHPIHSFLSWLIQLSDFNSPLELLNLLESSVDTSGNFRTLEIPNPLTSIFEYPIRTIVLMSQIKSGFWVRNGFSVRSQMQLYRNTGLRDGGYMRDLFLIQTFINTSNPNLVCFLLFNRWLLMDGWLVEEENKFNDKGEDLKDQNEHGLAYDVKTLPYMLEECLNFFIHVTTEDLSLRGLSEEKFNEHKIKNEIIHNLCFGPMSYTKLCSSMPDHITSSKRFDLYLSQITKFTPPNDSKDIGNYKLKDDYLDQVNPYYFNYTSNIRDDAIKFVKHRMGRKDLKATTDVVITPYTPNPDEIGVYKYIGNFSVSSYFSDFLIRVLKFISDEGIDKAESLLEVTLHLIHICSFEQLINIDMYGTFYDRFVNTSDKYGTSIAVLLYKILLEDVLKDHHPKIRSIFRIFEDKYHNLSEILSDQIHDFDVLQIKLSTKINSKENDMQRKKCIAKERQAKLMAKFKKQQSSFLKNHDFVDSDYSDTEMKDCEEDIGWKFPEAHCLLCQNAAQDAGPFGIITYISKSSEFRNVPFEDNYWFIKSFSDNYNLDEDEDCSTHAQEYSDNWKVYMDKIKANNVIGPGFSSKESIDNNLVSSSCGHGMHFLCYLNFLNSNKTKSNQITRNTPESIEHNEFLCPLCKAINNMFVPILWSTNKRSLRNYLSPNATLGMHPFEECEVNVNNKDWFQRFSLAARHDVEESSILTQSAVEMIGKDLSTKETSDQQHFRLLLFSMFQNLSLITFPSVFKADSTFILVNTIKSVEIGLRGVSSDNRLLINQLSNNTILNLRTLNEFRNTSLLMKINNWNPNPKDDAYVKMLSNLLALSTATSNSSILEIDFFELLVSTFPIPSAGFSFNSILKLSFLSHLIQICSIITDKIIAHYQNEEFSILDIPVMSNINTGTATIAFDLFKILSNHKDKDIDTEVLRNPRLGSIFFTMLVKASLPFLRRAAIFAHIVCADLDQIFEEKHKFHRLEADKLCWYLRIDTIEETLRKFSLFQSETFESDMFHKFLSRLQSYNVSDQMELRRSLEYPGIIKLAELPERLDFFFTDYYYSGVYDYPHRLIEDPAICLFCGEVVDSQKIAIGCKEGQATTHFSKECPNNAGIFFLPKERSFLLLHKNGGSFHDAPYLDQHGEVASETKRTKALYLSKPRYDDFIKNVWLQHNVANYIVRKLDSVVDAGGWDTL